MDIGTFAARIINALVFSEEPEKRQIDFDKSAPPDAPRQEGQVIEPQLSAPEDVPAEPVPAPVEPEDTDVIREPHFSEWFKTYLDPYFKASISQVTARRTNGENWDTPEMEETLNSRMPFATATLGLGQPNRLPPKYDLFGKEREIADKDIKLPFAKSAHDKDGDCYFVPNVEGNFAKNYSIGEKDYDIGGKLGTSIYIHPNDDNVVWELYGQMYAKRSEMEWPSLAIPNGHSLGGFFGAAVDIHFAPWLEFRTFGEAIGNQLRYYEENFGRDAETLDYGWNAGGRLYLKFARFSDYAPTVAAAFEGGNAIKYEVPIEALAIVRKLTPEDYADENRRDKDMKRLKANAGFYFGKALWNASIAGEYEIEELEDFNSIWTKRLSGSVGVPYVGELHVSGGEAEGGNHFYSIHTPWFIDAKWMAPDQITPEANGFKFPWGISATAAKYKDNQVPERPEHLVLGAALILEGNY